ncbi:MAG: glycerol-3-phosphate acyltransferase [Acidimicrobiia bacterium]
MSDVLGLVSASAAAYLLGAVPFALLIGFMLDVDLRKQGTRNVGAGNLTKLAGLRYGVVAAVLDGLKGLIPVLVVRRLGMASVTVSLAGLAAVIGHNWSIYLRSRSGRGMATAVGVVVGVAPVLLLWTTAWAVMGWRIGGGLGGFVGWGSLPVFALAAGQPGVVVILALALSWVIIARRVQGNYGRSPGFRAAAVRAVWDTDPVLHGSADEAATT